MASSKSVTKSKLVLLTTRQANKSRGELLGQRIVTLSGKLAEQDGKPEAQKTVSLSANSGSFYTTRGGTKAKHFLVPVSLRRGGVNFSHVQAFTGGPAQEVPWGLNTGVLAECSFTFISRRQGSEMGHCVEFKLIGNIPLVINL